MLTEGKTGDASALAKQRHDLLMAQDGATGFATFSAGYELGRIDRIGGQLDKAEAVHRAALAAILTVSYPAGSHYQQTAIYDNTASASRELGADLGGTGCHGGALARA